ncbi:STAS domain-containing protein [Marinobacter arenosus]|uniref:STAS domain-containing protein n=1 Tax=Marinobacter arenosus TaxID=2856822 RepID=UPI001C4ABDB6|nr:STAS domain-containing protein [Marinobacter arenosus]MBW0146873.1 STAS domain-containing protein [Marinobacter arenosus]
MTTPAPRVEMIDSVLTVSGEVDADSVVALRQQGEKLLQTVSVDLVVDLGSLQTAHSVVLSLLLCWQRLANQRGISLSYRGVSERLASLAALSNLDEQLAGFRSGSA